MTPLAGRDLEDADIDRTLDEVLQGRLAHPKRPVGSAERWAKYFDDPERGRWQKRHEAIRAHALAPFGQSVDRAAAPPAASAPTAVSAADNSVPDASAVFAVPQRATDDAAPTF